MSELADQSNGRARICTGVQHASTMVIVLGVFVLVAALNTDPAPEDFEYFGILLTGAGSAGFLAGWLGRQFYIRGSSD